MSEQGEREAERVLRRWFDAFDRDDMEAARALWAEDGVLHATTPPEIAGEVRGFDEFLAWYAKRRAITGTDFDFTVHDLVGSDVHAVALIRARAVDRSGVERLWRQLCVYHVDGGRITEMWIHEEPEGAA
jgi:ketosteroid isomerase-like protein